VNDSTLPKTGENLLIIAFHVTGYFLKSARLKQACLAGC
jgi:hypothetical protein